MSRLEEDLQCTQYVMLTRVEPILYTPPEGRGLYTHRFGGYVHTYVGTDARKGQE